MGKTRFKKAKELIEKIKKEKGKLITDKELIKEMESHLGSDMQRTICPYIKLMLKHNLVKEIGDKVELQ